MPLGPTAKHWSLPLSTAAHNAQTASSPPWDIEEHNRSCFIVRDNNGRALSYVYYETEPGRRTAANLLTRDEAHRIAANIAKLPELLRPGRKIKSPLRRRASLVRENQRVPAIPRRSK